MTFSVWFFRGVMAVLLCASMNGCMPASQSQSEEEKEPHFMAGRNALSSLDYKGAIEEFEKALEVNPHNASAHLQLGVLYEEKEPNPAIAVYHYEEYLKLNPSAPNADMIKQRILNCKQDLAKTVLTLPATPAMQRELDRLIEQNKHLQEQVDQWQAYYKAQSQQASPSPTQALSRTTSVVAPGQTAQTGSARPAPMDNHPTPRTISTRTHTVESGDTLASIARKYGVRLDALMSANPGLDPRKLRVGQVVKIP